jgi:large subunit ribosomal protein L21e
MSNFQGGCLQPGESDFRFGVSVVRGDHLGRRSKGYRKRTRKKLSKHVRERGPPPASKIIQDIKPGTRVVILIDPSIAKGQPHSRYHGRTGVVAERRGRAYVVEIREGGVIKSIISRPEHLRVVG